MARRLLALSRPRPLRKVTSLAEGLGLAEARSSSRPLRRGGQIGPGCQSVPVRVMVMVAGPVSMAGWPASHCELDFKALELVPHWQSLSLPVNQ